MEKTYEVKGMTCVICKNTVEKGLNKLDGVESCKVNLLENEATVVYDENKVSEELMAKTIKNLGYELIINKRNEIDFSKVIMTASVILTMLLMYLSMSTMHNPRKYMYHQLVISLIIILLNNHYYRSGFTALFHLNPNMDTLVSLSSSVSFLYSLYAMTYVAKGMHDHHLYFETAAMILTFVTIGKYIEGENKKKTTKTIRGLATLRPMQANLLNEDGTVEIIPIDNLKKNNVVIVRAGESIPQDGVIIGGSTSVDESMITGESIPLYKTVDSDVIGGTINLSGEIKVKITKNNAQTVLSNIISLTKQATMSKIPIERFADKVSNYFVFGVMAISLITFVVWYAFSKDLELSLNFAICVLVISCPCALGLATPSAIMVATGVSAKNGILIKNPEILEIAGSLKNIILDKTGTLTKNRLAIVSDKEYDTEFKNVLTSLEKSSNHPIAKAIKESYGEGNMSFDVFEEISGEGIVGKIGSDVYLAGNKKLMNNNGIDVRESDLIEASKNNYSIMLVGKNSSLLGVVYLADVIKESSKIAVSNLKKENINPIMCTGDNEIVARNTARILGIDEYLSGVKPGDKSDLVIKKKEEGKVGMVGDGVNDAIALSSADVSFSVSNGSDIAYATSDVILMANDINDVSFLVRLAKKTMRIIKQNLFWALFYNAVLIPVAAGVFYNGLGIKLDPMFGAGAMALSSIFVLTNALRINNMKKETINLMNKTVTIEGMMCQNCRKHVENALKELGADVTVSLEEGKAYIKETVLEDDAITSAIEEAGYEVKEIVND